MEVVVIGTDRPNVAEELRRRGIKVIMVPGNEVIVYITHTGFQELDGDVAERYISSLLELPYLIEYY